MTITRSKLADLIDAYDDDIRQSNEAKAEEYRAYRDQIEKQGWAKDRIKLELAAVKAAIRKRQRIAQGKPVEEQEDLTDAVFLEISAPRAPARERAA